MEILSYILFFLVGAASLSFVVYFGRGDIEGWFYMVRDIIARAIAMTIPTVFAFALGLCLNAITDQAVEHNNNAEHLGTAETGRVDAPVRVCETCGFNVSTPYCGYCGALVEVEATCPNCGAECTTAYCGDCGASMDWED